MVQIEDIQCIRIGAARPVGGLVLAGDGMRMRRKVKLPVTWHITAAGCCTGNLRIFWPTYCSPYRGTRCKINALSVGQQSAGAW